MLPFGIMLNNKMPWTGRFLYTSDDVALAAKLGSNYLLLTRFPNEKAAAA